MPCLSFHDTTRHDNAYSGDMNPGDTGVLPTRVAAIPWQQKRTMKKYHTWLVLLFLSTPFICRAQYYGPFNISGEAIANGYSQYAQATDPAAGAAAVANAQYQQDQLIDTTVSGVELVVSIALTCVGIDPIMVGIPLVSDQDIDNAINGPYDNDEDDED